MKKIYLTITLQLLCLMSINSQVAKYFKSYLKEKSFNYTIENKILSTIPFGKLQEKLKPYYNDTLYQIRQQAYYLIYKSGEKANTEDKQQAVQIILSGCFDKNKTVVKRCISYLKNYPVDTYNSQSKEQLNKLIQKKETANIKEAYLLAGYVGVGIGTIQQQLFKKEEYTKKQQWYMHLTLARMGDEQSIQFCIQQAKQVKAGNNKIAFIIPELIYTRQKEAIDYCINIIHSDKKNCYSPNPDLEAKILCGYRVLELLAPIIEEFPYKAGPAGSLITDDYEEALHEARKWFKQHKDYKINKDKF